MKRPLEIKYKYDIGDDAWIVQVKIPCGPYGIDTHRMRGVVHQIRTLMCGLFKTRQVKVFDHYVNTHDTH